MTCPPRRSRRIAPASDGHEAEKGIGHFAVGLASKAAAPKASLGALLGAAMLPDLIWPLLLLAGWERVRIAPGDTAFSPLSFDHYPWSHSLLMALVWAALAAIAYGRFARYATGAVFVGIGVISHWVLDWVSHRADLPLWPGASPVVGLSLWNSVPATVVVETAMFASALWVYLRVTRARDRRGRYGLWSFVAVALSIYAASAGGAPPPSLEALKVVALSTWVIPLWAWWFDRHRVVRVWLTQ